MTVIGGVHKTMLCYSEKGRKLWNHIYIVQILKNLDLTNDDLAAIFRKLDYAFATTVILYCERFVFEVYMATGIGFGYCCIFENYALRCLEEWNDVQESSSNSAYYSMSLVREENGTFKITADPISIGKNFSGKEYKMCELLVNGMEWLQMCGKTGYIKRP